MAAVSGIESATGLAAAMLDESAQTPTANARSSTSLARQLHAEVALYDARGRERALERQHPRDDRRRRSPDWGWQMRQGGPALNLSAR